jgi:hypothetical protein
MSFISPGTAEKTKDIQKWVDPLGVPLTSTAYSLFGKGLNKPGPPGPPNPNDAANAARSQTDAMRMRRGLLANIYAGSQSGQPVTGKVALGT